MGRPPVSVKQVTVSLRGSVQPAETAEDAFQIWKDGMRKMSKVLFYNQSQS